MIITPKRIKAATGAAKTPVASPFRKSPANSPSVPKTDEEKRIAERIETNRVAAKMKLEAKVSRGLAINMGASWYKAFEKEFSKDYFQKVVTFECRSHAVDPPRSS